MPSDRKLGSAKKIELILALIAVFSFFIPLMFYVFFQSYLQFMLLMPVAISLIFITEAITHLFRIDSIFSQKALKLSDKIRTVLVILFLAILTLLFFLDIVGIALPSNIFVGAIDTVILLITFVAFLTALMLVYAMFYLDGKERSKLIGPQFTLLIVILILAAILSLVFFSLGVFGPA